MRGDLWTPERDAELARLWAAGLRTREIAERMGLPSKNAVIGRAHRLALPRRANPIRRDGLVKPRRTPRTRRNIEAAARAPELSASMTCQWIDGVPSLDDACKCGAPAIVGRPYCEPHMNRAYIKPNSPAYKREQRAIDFIGGRKVIGADTAHLILAA